MIMNNVTLSICIPTYNRASALQKTLQSIVEQKIFSETDAIEIFISDNFSTDNTEETVSLFIKNHPTKITYIRQKTNIGPEKNIEFVLKNANGLFRKLNNDNLTFIDGSLDKMVRIIKSSKDKKPILFFLNGIYSYPEPTTACDCADDFLKHVSYYSTWIGGFGLWNSDIDDLPDFNTLTHQLPQTDILYSMIHQGRKVLVSNVCYFLGQHQGRKGGYNIAEVFGKNYLSILKKYLPSNEITQESYEAEKVLLLKNHIIPFYFNNQHDFIQSGFLEFLYDYSKNDYFYKSIISTLIGPEANIKYSNILEMKRAIWQLLNQHNRTYINKETDITKISVGIHTYGPLNIFTWDHPNEKISIGNFVSIGEEVKFLLGGEHQYNNFSTFPFKVLFLNQTTEALTKGAIIVEDDVWIGNGATILSGVTIGKGSIVGAASVVTKNVPPYAIVAGNPARIIKYRFNDEIIQKLITIDFSKITHESILNNENILYEEITNENIDEIVSAFNRSNLKKENSQIPLRSVDSKSFMIPQEVPKKRIAYLADPFDTDNYLDLTLNILSPISNLKDYSIEPLLQKSNGRYHIKTDLLADVHAVIIYDKAAYLSHFIPQIKACGVPVLFYVHTDVWNVDVKHAAKEALDLLQRHYRSCIELADIVITSNEYLSHAIGKDNEVITPLIDISPWNEPTQKLPRFSDKFTLAVYVDMHNLNDISMIAKFIQTIQKKYTDELYFVVHAINCPPSELEALSFVDVKLTKIDNYLQYIHFIRSQPIDAVLTPLIANTHNLTVSPFNYFIQSLCGIPGIYSNWGLYKEVVQHGATGFLCDENELEWEAAIVTLMHHPDTREQIAGAAQKQVLENFTIDHVLRQIYDVLGQFNPPESSREISDSLKKPLTQYELKSFLSYPVWCDAKALESIDTHVWESLAQSWDDMADFHFFVQADETDLANLADTIDSFVAQLYPGWNLYIISPIVSPNPLFDEHSKLHWIQTEGSLYSAINYVSTQLERGMVGFLSAGDKLQPHALTAYAEVFNSSGSHLVYSDHDILSESKNRIHPQFKPDFNLDMFRSKDYISRSFVISSAALKELNGLRLELSEGELYDLILRYHDRFGGESIGHFSDILHSLVIENKTLNLRILSSKIALKQHLNRNELIADVIDGIEESFRILYHHEEEPLVSIIIPTKNQVHFLRPCIDSILEKTAYVNYEIIIIDNQSDEAEAVEYLGLLRMHEKIQVIAYHKPFNYSTANNIGAEHSKGDFILLLNNDTEILHENWLDVLLSYGQRKDVGIVGPRLIYPNQTIQHAGVILGINNSADHPFIGVDLEDPGYMSRLQIDQNLSAVTAAAMLIKRSVFDAVSGLDDTHYHVNYSDIDLCLKVIEAGYKILFTPHATLLHHGSVTQKNIDIKKIKERNKRFLEDQKAFQSRWSQMILHDPAYNVNLDTADSLMAIRTQALAHWNPLLKSPIPKILGMARGSDGGGFYRIISPLNALQSSGKAQTYFAYKNYLAAYIMMQQPDIIVYQTPLHDNMINFLEYIKTFFPKVTLIYEIDDLLTNIPIDNRAFHNQYKDTSKRLLKGLKYCDRMVVSTQPLKDAFETYIDDIRIIPNYLPKALWGTLQSKRNRSEKLRVGWAGSIFHKGDLALISKLVENYHDAVEWVFFGMAPEGLDGKIEFHPGVSLEHYPEKLATLDLDLALVPLEDNAFNAAKSNLRLLEFGILGWPVICSDVYPYREAPVTRVKNRYKDWEKAFLSKISDAAALKNEGDQLKKWVEENYMLEDHVDFITRLYTEPKK